MDVMNRRMGWTGRTDRCEIDGRTEWMDGWTDGRKYRTRDGGRIDGRMDDGPDHIE
jgi:hypothetical protein